MNWRFPSNWTKEFKEYESARNQKSHVRGKDDQRYTEEKWWWKA
jgi:hypothetical protein